jgi:hypothetical protein
MYLAISIEQPEAIPSLEFSPSLDGQENKMCLVPKRVTSILTKGHILLGQQ